MDDNTILRVLITINSISSKSAKRSRFVTSFMADPFRSYKEIGESFGVSWNTARYHIYTAAIEHPEIRKLVDSEMRKEIVRKRGQKRRMKQ